MKSQSQKPGGLQPLLDAGANAAAQGVVRSTLLAKLLPFAGVVSLALKVLLGQAGQEGSKKDGTRIKEGSVKDQSAIQEGSKKDHGGSTRVGHSSGADTGTEEPGLIHARRGRGGRVGTSRRIALQPSTALGTTHHG